MQIEDLHPLATLNQTADPIQNTAVPTLRLASISERSNVFATLVQESVLLCSRGTDILDADAIEAGTSLLVEAIDPMTQLGRNASNFCP